MTFPLFTTIPPKSDFRPFVQNWRASGFKVTSINNPEEAKALRAAGIDVLEVQAQEKKLKISDIMFAIASTDEPFAGFINADCRFIAPLDTEALKMATKNSVITAERIDVDKQGAVTGAYCMGFDAFFFDTAPLRAAAPCSEFRIGQPWWDYWFPYYCQSAGLKLKRFECPILLHISHDLNWSVKEFHEGAKRLHAHFPEAPVYSGAEPYPPACFEDLRGEPVPAPSAVRTVAPILESIQMLVADGAGSKATIASTIAAKIAAVEAEIAALLTVQRRTEPQLRNSMFDKISHRLQLAASSLNQPHAAESSIVDFGRCENVRVQSLPSEGKAVYLEEDASFSVHRVEQVGIPVVPNQRYTVDIVARPRGRNQLRIEFRDKEHIGYARATFDLWEGRVVASTNEDDVAVGPADEGWVRCQLSLTPMSDEAIVTVTLVGHDQAIVYQGRGQGGIDITPPIVGRAARIS
jgi:hypothetical protein